MILLDKETLENIEVSSKKEWIITNGIGGYASSTVMGMNTRRYHGLLCSSFNPPTDRLITLSKLDEEVKQGENEWLLSTTNYGKIIHPRGFNYLSSFSLNPFPVSIFEFGENTLKKTVYMIQGENTVIISYSFTKGSEPIELTIYPLITYRDYHSLKLLPYEEMKKIIIDRGIKIQFHKPEHSLSISSDSGEFIQKDTNYRNIFHSVEAERGFDAIEDYFNPGRFKIVLNPGQSFSVMASTTITNFKKDPKKIFMKEVERTNEFLEKFPYKDEFTAHLALTADSFCVKRRSINTKTIIAGYHWFTDWSRDAMISVPGLLNCLGKKKEALQILTSFSELFREGLLPNRFPDDSGDPLEYNSIDAPLWFINAVHSYYHHTKDYMSVKNIFLKPMQDILNSYIDGTVYNIGIDKDYLIKGGDANTNLTWMDAVCGLYPVTPRWGKAVEINALFFNALNCVNFLLKECGFPGETYVGLAKKVGDSFCEKFIREDGKGLYDLVQNDVKDDSIRPNQIFAVSLFYSPLLLGDAINVVKTVNDELLTPYGLRSLSQGHKDYRGIYEGNPRERDAAYHQGTVWAYLLGPYISAFLKINNYSNQASEEIEKFLEPMKMHLLDAGLGSISEIFDGDAPHAPKGTISQAWSVGELLRASIEDINGKIQKPLLHTTKLG